MKRRKPVRKLRNGLPLSSLLRNVGCIRAKRLLLRAPSINSFRVKELISSGLRTIDYSCALVERIIHASYLSVSFSDTFSFFFFSSFLSHIFHLPYDIFHFEGKLPFHCDTASHSWICKPAFKRTLSR